MENRLAFVGETRGAIRHQAFALGGTNGLAQVGLARQAEFALAAFRGVQRDHMVADGHRGHALADRFNHCTAFMAEDRREDTFRVGARQGVGVGVAYAGRHHPQQHFAGLGHGDIHFNDLQRLLGFEGYGSAGLDHPGFSNGLKTEAVSVKHGSLINNPGKSKTLLLYRDNRHAGKPLGRHR